MRIQLKQGPISALVVSLLAQACVSVLFMWVILTITTDPLWVGLLTVVFYITGMEYVNEWAMKAALRDEYEAWRKIVNKEV